MAQTDLDRKLSALEARYEELNTLLASPEVGGDTALLQRYGREHASLSDVVNRFRNLTDVRRQREETEQMLADGLDEDLRALAREELEQLRRREDGLLEEVRLALLPKDIMDDRNAIVTIQA